jgi:neutral ceramidase
MPKLLAGAAQVDITPKRPMHLYGYPHVERTSTGVHDPLMASALYVRAGSGEALFISVDIIFVSKAMAARVRRRISSDIGVAEDSIVVSATHTHSGPGTVRYLSNEADPTVPPPDAGFLHELEDGIVQAANRAVTGCCPAEAGLVVANGACTGGNRRDSAGPNNPRVPVLAVRDDQQQFVALLLVCSMHPTVLHEDSTVISADFVGATRRYLQENLAGERCPVLHHCGACGNQSPRHVTRANSMDEATRVGRELGQSIERAISQLSYTDEIEITCDHIGVRLPLRSFPAEAHAMEALTHAQARFAALRRNGADRTAIRTAECDVFGAEETLTLAKAASEGRIETYAESCMPAEVQYIGLGPWKFVALPGELFVEFGLAIESASPNTFVITLANGELQGYLVTEDSVAEGGYEASNAIFKSPESGHILVQAARKLIHPEKPAP